MVGLAGFEHGDESTQVFPCEVKQGDFVTLVAVVSKVPVVGKGLGIVDE